MGASDCVASLTPSIRLRRASGKFKEYVKRDVLHATAFHRTGSRQGVVFVAGVRNATEGVPYSNPGRNTPSRTTSYGRPLAVGPPGLQKSGVSQVPESEKVAMVADLSLRHEPV